jgi:anti-sigma factor RsiW
MNCEAVKKDLSALLDGALEGETADAVCRHLETCGACAAAYEAMQAADADAGKALRAVAEGAELSGQFTARVLADIARREQKPVPLWRRPRVRRPALAVAAVVVAALATWAIVVNVHHPAPTTATAPNNGAHQPEAAHRASFVLTTLDLPSVRDLARELLGGEEVRGPESGAEPPQHDDEAPTQLNYRPGVNHARCG